MLFFDAATQYLEKEKYNLASASLRTYYWNLKKLNVFKSDLQCEELNADIIQEYKAFLVERGNKPVTINKALSV